MHARVFRVLRHRCTETTLLVTEREPGGYLVPLWLLHLRVLLLDGKAKIEQTGSFCMAIAAEFHEKVPPARATH